MNIEIRTPASQQEWNAYYDLRYRILRAPLDQPLGSELNEQDSEGVHFALYDQNILKAIARLDQAEESISQVRFVAVEANSQGKGYGRQIMLATENEAIKRGDTKMILHARDYAVDFYLKLDYEIVEKSYLLFDVLQHFLMDKKL
jgi:predicted GNAT family N-acyltransferase